MARTTVIVQARLGSSRLPGKVLADLAGRTALARCLERVAATGFDVAAAVPEGAADDSVAEAASAAGFPVVRGDEQDVLSRYAKAARQRGADVVVRVTADCPFIDPRLCVAVRGLLDLGCDYACSNMPATWPHGLDCEAFSAEWLHEADRAASDPADREHVTPWLRRHPALRRASVKGPNGLARLRWTLDYPEDLAFCRAACAALRMDPATATTADIVRVCAARPDIVAINAHRVDETRLARRERADVTLALDLAAMAAPHGPS